MIALCIREIATSRGLSLALLQRKAQLPVSTARRYWHSSRSGLARDTGTLREVNLATLDAIAALLQVSPGTLLVQRNEETTV